MLYSQDCSTEYILRVTETCSPRGVGECQVSSALRGRLDGIRESRRVIICVGVIWGALYPYLLAADGMDSSTSAVRNNTQDCHSPSRHLSTITTITTTTTTPAPTLSKTPLYLSEVQRLWPSIASLTSTVAWKSVSVL